MAKRPEPKLERLKVQLPKITLHKKQNLLDNKIKGPLHEYLRRTKPA